MYQQQAPMQVQIKRKSHVLGFILELFGGLGFLYAGSGWGKAIIFFVLTWALSYAPYYLQHDHPTFAYIIGIVSFLFFLYREFSLMRFISRHNRGGY